ncbi:CD209 antigen-like [Plectropomus leopardus]|uniref:CD209 antigen-like n=1 Tax=Plectropomus leopardus TaxID=160734 RepID=UPI001C4C1DEC|nr:CD209 antigen-like [Plectropomus leopardus]
MAVENHASTVTNMEYDNSKVGYKQLLEDGSKFRYSVYALRNSPFKVATFGLGLLCVLLLAGVIGQSVHYQKVEQDHQNNLNAMTNKRNKLQENLRTERNQKKELETTRSQLQQRNDYLSQRKKIIETNNNLLIQQQQELQLVNSKLQASNAAFTKEIQQLKSSKDQLQTSFHAVSTAKTLLQKKHDLVVKRKTEVQASYESLTKDRDNLLNKFNNVTRSKDQLQLSYNDLIKRVEHLQDRYNFSTSEKDKLKSSHQNLTISQETLKATYDLLLTETEKLRATYSSLVQEKEEVENSCKNTTVERDLLKVKNDNLTAERDELQAEIERMKTMVPAKKCPTGWTTFQRSCYFTSVGKKSWNASRTYCQGSGADLAIIKSKEEMQFINGLYSSDKEVWIGLTDEGIEGQWKWVDGTTLTTSFWDKDQPNSLGGRNQDCVEFWHRATGMGGWNDENCDIEQNFICEM